MLLSNAFLNAPWLGRAMRAAALAVAATTLAGCAAMNRLNNDVSTYSQWPAGRAPGSYAFERLPSQQARAEAQQRLEDAARPALEMAGFTPAADPQQADFVVQVGARVNAYASPWDDPFYWRGSVFWGRRSFWGPGWGLGMGYTGPDYEREVAVLIRDRKSGQPLYEARASNDGASPSIESLLPAMFEAAMKDFPHTGINPRKVTTEITKKP